MLPSSRRSVVILTLALCALALAGRVVHAQAPAPVQPSPSAAAAPAPTLPSPETYTYDPAGRRDPFVSLVARGAEGAPAAGARPEGLPGMAVNDLSVRGLLETRTGYVAMVQGPDNKTYLVRTGDRLLDGVVKSVNAQGLLILQQVTDPLSLVKQKEIRKGLRGSEEGK